VSLELSVGCSFSPRPSGFLFVTLSLGDSLARSEKGEAKKGEVDRSAHVVDDMTLSMDLIIIIVIIITIIVII
jgi:hypothetical protein